MLVDSHHIMRDGLRALLERYPEFEIVAEAGDGRSAMELAVRHRPDIVLCEVALPLLNGIELTRRIRDACPETRVLALSSHQERHLISGMLAAGASGYVPKTCDIDELVQALRVLTRDQSYVSPLVAGAVIDEFVRHAAPSTLSGTSPLTPREREVLQLLAEGHSVKEIAVLLDVSPKTIETHRHHVMTKLDIHGIAELTRYALREGITSL